MKQNPSRRKFIKQLGGTSLLLAAGSLQSLASDDTKKRSIPNNSGFGPNDKIRVATIGMGIMGIKDTDSALKVPGV
jgi:hypothetical protein